MARSSPTLSPAAAERRRPGHVLALAWTQLGGTDTTLDGWVRDRPGAATGRRFMAAVERYRAPSRTWPSRTATGRIGMISPGLVPIRRSGDGRLPVPGWTGDYDWIGTIPAAGCRAAAIRRAGCWSTPTTGWSTTAIPTC